MEAMECLDEQVEKEIHGGEPTKVGFIRFQKYSLPRNGLFTLNRF